MSEDQRMVKPEFYYVTPVYKQKKGEFTLQNSACLHCSACGKMISGSGGGRDAICIACFGKVKP